MTIKDIKDSIISIKDYPNKGILFRDITPIFLNSDKVKFIISEFVKLVKDLDFDVIVAPESRGYLFGLPLALELNKPFIMVRKPNKLPRKTLSIDYTLEYGQNTLQMHQEDLKPNSKVLIVDDLLATGGTSFAIQKLIHLANCKTIGHLYLIELLGLCDKSKIEGNLQSLIQYS